MKGRLRSRVSVLYHVTVMHTQIDLESAKVCSITTYRAFVKGCNISEHRDC
jgi:hypothetical protein